MVETITKGGEPAGFQFKPQLAAVLAVLNGVSVGLAYIQPRKNNGNNHMVRHNNRRNSRTKLLQGKSLSLD